MVDHSLSCFAAALNLRFITVPGFELRFQFADFDREIPPLITKLFESPARSALSKTSSCGTSSVGGSWRSPPGARRGMNCMSGSRIRWFMKLGDTISTPSTCRASSTDARSRERVRRTCLTSFRKPAMR